MAGADSSIYSMIRPQATVRLQDPLEQQSKKMQLQQLMGQQEMQALQLGEARSGIERNRRVQDLFATNPNATPDQLAPIDYKAAQELRDRNLKAEGTRASTDKARAEALAKNVGVLRDQAVAITDQAGWDMWRENVAKILSPDLARTIPQQFTPEAKLGVIQTAAQLLERLSPKLEFRDLGGSQAGFDPYTGVQKVTAAKTVTPDAVLTDERTRAEGAANRGVTIRGQNMSDARARDLAQATRDAAATGRIPPGYRMKTDGTLEAIPGGPADAKVDQKAGETKRTLDAYVAARDGLMESLEGTMTGAVSGRMPAFTTAQQVSEGAVAAMAPVLKQLFRSAGEGVFTDRDQQLLIDMVPKRTDTPEAAAKKIENIDRIVAAKLGAPVPAAKRRMPKGNTLGADPKKLSNDELLRELNR